METPESFNVLVASEGWQRFLLHMEQAEARYMEKLLGGSKEDFDYTKGVIEGMRLAASYPQRWLKQQQA
jgi:hypothetical protein